MSVIQIEISRLLAGAERTCTARNQSLPVELGKSLYEPCEGGVLFSQAHYLLDSAHSNYTNDIAKIIYDESQASWLIFVPLEDEESVTVETDWVPYPFLSQSPDLSNVLREIEKDPKSYFWR